MSAICLYDREDREAGQVLVGEAGLVLAALLDGTRTVEAVRSTFGLRTGTLLDTREIADFVHSLDRANLLDSERHRARRAAGVASFRRARSRPAVHAGGAYPAEPRMLRSFLDACATRPGGPGLRRAAKRGRTPRALIAPHIDLHRGGHSYAWGYGDLAGREPADIYVLLGTCHLPMAFPFAATAKSFDTPLGPVPTDRVFLDRLAARAPYDPFADEYAHRSEHSLEFQALYLRYLAHAPPAAIVPVLCVPPTDLPPGATPSASRSARAFLEALRETIDEDGRRVCLVVGADFAHVGPQFGDPAPVSAEFARRVELGDRAMLELIACGDADGFWRQVVDEPAGHGMADDARAVGGPRRICGLAPIYAVLWLLGPSEGRVLHYDQWIDSDGGGSVTFGCVMFP